MPRRLNDAGIEGSELSPMSPAEKVNSCKEITGNSMNFRERFTETPPYPGLRFLPGVFRRCFLSPYEGPS
jgi:hypothetical protein